jgi:hypothetical protein
MKICLIYDRTINLLHGMLVGNATNGPSTRAPVQGRAIWQPYFCDVLPNERCEFDQLS